MKGFTSTVNPILFSPPHFWPRIISIYSAKLNDSIEIKWPRRFAELFFNLQH